jgi:SAM-dependent methyltransferase
VDRDDDLIAYYDAEARGGHRTSVGEYRTELLDHFARLLADEDRRRLVDVGAGPGLDALAWRRRRFAVVGLDLGRANCGRMRDAGVTSVAGSLYAMPFRDGSFDALWTMSTFVHVPHERFDAAIGEMLRLVRPGAPLGIGTWGGHDYEGVPEVGHLRPYRFFSLAAHDRWRAMLARHGVVERFEVHDPHTGAGWQYQFAVLRAPG